MLRKSLKIILFLSIGFGQIIVKDNFTPTLDKHDITYNFIGITTAYLLDKLIQRIKKKHLKPKIVTD